MDGVPVRIDSTPAGAEVRIDGTRRGQTPALLSLSPGPHSLLVHQADSLDLAQPIEVPPDGTSTSVNLWRRQPAILPLRAMYPGANLADGRFLLDGRVGLSVNTRSGASVNQPGLVEELWQLDPAVGSLARLSLASASDTHVSAVALAHEGQLLAYATGRAATSNSLWPTSGGRTDAAAAALASVRVSRVDGTNTRTVLELTRTGSSVTDTEHITGLVWTPDSQRLVVVTRSDATPARSRLLLVEPGASRDGDDGAGPRITELVVLPAEVVPASAITDPTGQWLAFAAHTTTSSNTNNVVTLCVVELQPGGTLTEVADLGPAQRMPAVVPLAWARRAANTTSARLAFVAPVPEANATSGTGLFDIFGALRPPAAPSGLFVVDLNTRGGAAQPRRIGTFTGVAAPVWRNESTIYGFSRQDDGSLSLHAVDVASGEMRDTGAHIPAGVVQGAGLAARWDVEHARVLLLTCPKTAGNGSSAGLQAWLVSFVGSNEVQP